MKEYVLKVSITTPEGITHEEIEKKQPSQIVKYDRDLASVLEGSLNNLSAIVVDAIFEED